MHGRRAARRGQRLTDQRERWERSWALPAEDHRWFRSRVEPIIAETAARADLPSGAAVDVGCGAGGVTRLLGKHFPIALGLDLAFHAVEQARARGGSDHAAFGVADACVLPLRDGAASLVVDRGCLHCLTVATARTYLEEVARVLSPGGRFVLIARMAAATPPLHWTLRHPLGAVMEVPPRLRRKQPGSMAQLLTSLDSVVAFLPSAFEVEHIERGRLRSDSGWHLRHLRLVARRTAGN